MANEEIGGMTAEQLLGKFALEAHRYYLHEQYVGDIEELRQELLARLAPQPAPQEGQLTDADGMTLQDWKDEHDKQAELQRENLRIAIMWQKRAEEAEAKLACVASQTAPQELPELRIGMAASNICRTLNFQDGAGWHWRKIVEILTGLYREQSQLAPLDFLHYANEELKQQRDSALEEAADAREAIERMTQPERKYCGCLLTELCDACAEGGVNDRS